MGMKKQSAAIMALGLAAMLAESNTGHYERPEPRMKKEKDFIVTEDKREQLLLKKGLKKFYYKLEYVIALNQKSADKKAKKLGYI